jgi:hypothetical protein
MANLMTPTIKCHHILDQLPPVPEQFVELALSMRDRWDELAKGNDPVHTVLNTKVGNPQSHPFYNKTFINEAGITVRARSAPSLRIGTEWEQWVRENISDKFLYTGLLNAIYNAGKEYPNSNQLQPHTDSTRDYLLIYLLRTSNADQWTRWYQEEGHPVRRSRDTRSSTVTNLIQVDEVYAPLHTWVLLDTNVLHAAGNILEERLSIGVSFDQDVFNVFDHSAAQLEEA